MTTTRMSTPNPEVGWPGSGRPVRLTAWSLGHPVLAIVGWVLLVVLSIGLGSVVGLRQATSTQLTIGEAGRAATLAAAAGLAEPDTETVVFGGSGRVPAATVAAVHQDLAVTLGRLPDVADVGGPSVSPDGSSAIVPVTLRTAGQNADPLRHAVTAVAARHPGLGVSITGSTALDADVNGQLGADFHTALILSLPVTVVILLLAFGALLAAGVPVLLGATSVLSAVGLYSVVSHLLPDGGSTTELILLVGMAVGVDYSLFYLKREREERRRGHTGPVALRVAAATAGHAVVTSGCAVAVAMAGLLLLGGYNFTAMAVGGILVVGLAVLGSLTALPAVLGLLGDRVDRPRLPLLRRWMGADRPGRWWPLVLRPVLRFPAAALVVGVGLLVALAWPAHALHLKDSTVEDLPRELPSVVAYERVVAAFPDQQSTLEVVAAGDQSRTVVDRVVAGIAADRRFGADPQISTAGATTVARISVPFAGDSTEAASALTAMRSTIVPAASAGQTGVEVAVGGGVAADADYLDQMSGRAPWVVLFVLAFTFALMTWTFRSVVVGLVTILANVLSAAAAFGVLALVFQSSWGAALLGFHLTGAVIAWIPVFLFVLLFGLSMDYHVLVISRIKENVDRGMSTREAIREGVTASASVITSAAAVMIAVFAIFAGLSMVEFKELGVGLGVAVLLDVVVVRILVLPALMSLLGRANWWAPAFLARRAGRARRGDALS